MPKLCGVGIFNNDLIVGDAEADDVALNAFMGVAIDRSTAMMRNGARQK